MVRVRVLRMILIVFVVCSALGHGPVGATSQGAIESYAIVGDDATLQVQGRTIHLFGVHVLDTERQCLTIIRPIRCGSRAALALELKIDGFVRCLPQALVEDGSISAVCFARGDSILDPPVDLGAWLIERGLAVALPGAPFEYTVAEKIARSQRRGFWGFFADDVVVPR